MYFIITHNLSIIDTTSCALKCPLLTVGGAAVAAVLRLFVHLLRGDHGRLIRVIMHPRSS